MHACNGPLSAIPVLCLVALQESNPETQVRNRSSVALPEHAIRTYVCLRHRVQGCLAF